MKTQKIGKTKYIIGFITLFFLFSVGCLHLRNKLTYLEIQSVNTSGDTYLALENNGDVLEQTFIMPYEIINSLSVQINTFARDNNSHWTLQLVDQTKDRMVYEDTFDASLLKDQEYNRFEFDQNIRVHKGNSYSFRIIAKDVRPLSSLAFYHSKKSEIQNAELSYNGKSMDADLCFQVYGGDADNWWCGFALFLFLILCLLLIRCCIVERRGMRIRDDRMIGAIVVALITFALFSTFAVGQNFMDESDNILGGKVIARGGVLYRDYVTQHTPLTYYLCAIFALFGAKSPEQFRLSFYIFLGLIWGFAYFRHSDFFGKKVMLFLPIAEVVLINPVVSFFDNDRLLMGTLVLADTVQALFTILLLFELLRYLQDKKLDWPRSIIVSFCLWGGIGAAFLSVYAYVWVALIVLLHEVKYWLNKREIKIKAVFGRYSGLTLCIISLPAAAAIYFKVNHSLGRAIDQFYFFNREVYPKYTGGFGGSLIGPFVNAIKSFFSLFADNFHAILTLSITFEQIVQIVLMTLAVTGLILFMRKGGVWEATSLGLVMIFSATRGYGFHAMAAWYIAIMIIVLFQGEIRRSLPKIPVPGMIIVIILLSHSFVAAVAENLNYEQSPVSELEAEVIRLTEKDENKDIFIDLNIASSTYLFSKNRYPVNSGVFMLPWYMDWYEDDNVRALNEKKPRVVIYYEEEEVWGYTHYAARFVEELKKNYTCMGDEGWKNYLWIRKD